jgi:capsular exopolysaccharide synthesis family protein
LDNTINTPDDLARIVSLPVLAMIPRHGEKSGAMRLARRREPTTAAPAFDLITHLDRQAVASEAYRELRTSILLSYPGSPPQRIAITSASPEEGKTATTVNLAIALAQLGRRVIIVDTDLRRPRLHKVFSVENSKGVTNYLSGLETQPDKLVIETSISNLDLMPSGPIAPNPSELLNSSIFAALAEHLLRQGYDHAIFDSPPVMAVADPVIIATSMDSAVLVARAGRTTRQALSLAAEKMVKSKLAHLGVVLNDVDLESAGSPYHYYRQYSSHRDLSQRSEDDASRSTDATA